MQLTTATIKTTGMHCHSCAMLVQMNVGDVPGVESVTVDAAAGTTDVTFDAEVTDVASIAEAIRSAGYGAEV